MPRSLFFAAAAMIAAQVPIQAHARPIAYARPGAAPVILKLEQFRRSVAFRVDIAGKQRLFQLDTGGGTTFISPEIARALGCEKGARLIGYRMTGDKLEAPRCDNVALTIGGHRFTAPVAGVYQVGQFNAKGVTVDGLVALDLFAGRTITIDFAGLRLIVETPASAAARTAHATELPARMVRELGGFGLTVEVQVPSKVGHLGFEIDSGNGGTLLIARPFAAGFGFDPARGPLIGEFPVGRGIAARGLVIPADIILDGNLGMPFLKHYLVTLDLARGRLWLAPNRQAPPPGMGEPPPLPPAADAHAH